MKIDLPVIPPSEVKQGWEGQFDAHYECVLDWTRPVEEKVGVNTLVQGSVVGASVDDGYLVDDVAEAYRRRGLVYHFSEFYCHAKRSCSGGGGFYRPEVNGMEFGA